MRAVEHVDFRVYDKRDGWRGARRLRQSLAEPFDALLVLQTALRAGVLSRMVKARVRVGYDPARSRDLHGWFVNRRIRSGPETHVVDVLQRFLDAIDVPPATLRWDLPITDDARRFAEQRLGSRPTLIVSPCSSHPQRDWLADRYAAVIDHAADHLGLHPVLCGGPTGRERDMGAAIEQASGTAITNLIGRDTLPQLAALLARASVVITPDSGPAHIANAVGTDVIGLYAATDPRRSGPYNSLRWCVDKHEEAWDKLSPVPAHRRRWGYKVEREGVMSLISVADVIERLEAWARSRQP